MRREAQFRQPKRGPYESHDEGIVLFFYFIFPEGGFVGGGRRGGGR